MQGVLRKPYGKRAAAAIVLAVTALLVVSPMIMGAFDPHPAPGNPTAPVTLPAQQEIQNRPTQDNLWSVEGRIQAIDRDARTLTVNGFTFQVPDPVYPTGPNAGLDVDVADPKAPSGEAITWENLTDPTLPSPVGFTVIAEGLYSLEPGVGEAPATIRFTPRHIFVEEAENVILGVATHNRESPDPHPGLFVNGVPIVMEDDPRFAPFNTIVDLAGNPISLEQVPEGTIVSMEGDWDAARGVFEARAVEAEFLADAEGQDTVVITRAEARLARGLIRVDGIGSDRAQTITLYGSTVAGESCQEIVARDNVIVSGVPIDDLEGEFSIRRTGIFAPSNPLRSVCAVSTGGGMDEVDLVFR